LQSSYQTETKDGQQTTHLTDEVRSLEKGEKTRDAEIVELTLLLPQRQLGADYSIETVEKFVLDPNLILQMYT
jgi:hypothetical protein